MLSYKKMLQHVLDEGVDSNDRTGVGTRKVFGYQFRHEMRRGFPLLTSKKMWPKIVFAELCWMLSGSTNVKELQRQGVTIWDEWADSEGNLGRVYGAQWRGFDGPHNPIDQIQEVFATLQKNPDSRRMIVTSWHPGDISHCALPPCHMLFQFGTMPSRHPGIKYRLNLHMIQRSADLFLGVPYNIAFYAALLHLFCRCLGMEPGELVISFTDLHIYNNHITQVLEQMQRPMHKLPSLFVDPAVRLPWEAKPTDFDLADYKSEAPIKAEVAV